jgi:hypothetical protein
LSIYFNKQKTIELFHESQSSIKQKAIRYSASRLKSRLIKICDSVTTRPLSETSDSKSVVPDYLPLASNFQHRHKTSSDILQKAWLSLSFPNIDSYK